MTPEEQAKLIARVAAKAAELVAFGYQGGTVEVPELGETWTITREGTANLSIPTRRN